jgi:hypothetical protein
METILNYLSQQSTWKGLIGLATAAGVALSPEVAAQIIATGMALVGLINVLRDEKKAK